MEWIYLMGFDSKIIKLSKDGKRKKPSNVAKSINLANFKLSDVGHMLLKRHTSLM